MSSNPRIKLWITHAEQNGGEGKIAPIEGTLQPETWVDFGALIDNIDKAYVTWGEDVTPQDYNRDRGQCVDGSLIFYCGSVWVKEGGVIRDLRKKPCEFGPEHQIWSYDGDPLRIVP